MLAITALKAFSDNYIWVISQDNQAIIVDPGEATPVIKHLAQYQLNPIAILITHHHDDHIGGVSAIQDVYPDIQIIAHREHGLDGIFVDESDRFELLGAEFTTWRTAGHTDTHLSYLCQADDKLLVFCGDTLFSGGCGRVFTGTIKELYDSMTRFNQLPTDTLFYPAHEYTLANLRFGLSVCTDEYKDDIAHAINLTQEKLAQGQPSLPTTLEQERRINVFLHTHHDNLYDSIGKNHSQKDHSALAVFTALRELKNNFSG
ncbi:hydroxyacylglutathione hydrolase [Moraxella haemolytica]|uniref:hydroxyacylglutathione hydrolase n=1 Tax=Moraxella TaxID=475 RepID=UPI002543191E|nr:hydroxyacylglutathione hydrolase [Moraxella sp. ZY171148]WII96102.1 hydroxyacylglutathione hydrolase [Moraxella sp. ZY171148]